MNVFSFATRTINNWLKFRSDYKHERGSSLLPVAYLEYYITLQKCSNSNVKARGLIIVGLLLKIHSKYTILVE